MGSSERVIEKFGGQTKLAQLLGKRPSTVQYWLKAGTIPAKWHAQLLALAREEGIELYPGDLIDQEEDAVTTVSPTNSRPIAKWHGTLMIGSGEVAVYVLEDGRRVISRRSATNLLTSRKGGGNLENYIGVEALKGYLPEDLPDQMIEFDIPEVQHKNVQGMSAETFLEICTAYMQALDDGNLQTDRQKEIAVKAGMFLASCSKVGLVALIDEATGYQYVRGEDALRFKLKIFLEEEMRKWESTFPEELWLEFGRLTNWSGPISQRPKYWGKLVMELIYEYLDPDVAEWLKKHNPNPKKGQNHHQWLSSQYGLKKLLEHIWMVIGLAKACYSMHELKTKMAELYGRQPVQYTLFLPPPNATVQPKPPRSFSNSIGQTGDTASIRRKTADTAQLSLDL